MAIVKRCKTIKAERGEMMNSAPRTKLLIAVIGVVVIASVAVLAGILVNRSRNGATVGKVEEGETVVTEKDYGMANNPVIWADFPDPDVP